MDWFDSSSHIVIDNDMDWFDSSSHIFIDNGMVSFLISYCYR